MNDTYEEEGTPEILRRPATYHPTLFTRIVHSTGNISADAEKQYRAATSGNNTGEEDNSIAGEDSSSKSPVARVSATIRRATRLDYAPPQLQHSQSAPTMATAVERTPSQPRMVRSFHGEEYGDTQPMDSQIYRQYKSVRRSALGDDTLGTMGDITTNGAVRPSTLEEGDTGHIDLEVSHWDDRDVVNVPSSPTSSHYSELSPSTQHRVQTSSPSQIPAFAIPKTPATIGVKRNYRGEIVSSDIKPTPGSALASFFGKDGGGQVMSLTQAFNVTQAATSPIVDGPRSDPIFDRPSPNFVRPSSSYLPQPVSSPTKMPTSEFTRATTEPRDTYISMKESQELRERMQREARQKAVVNTDPVDEFDEMIAADEETYAHRREQLLRKERALKEFAKLDEPSVTRKAHSRSGSGSSIQQRRVRSSAAAHTVEVRLRKAVEVVDNGDSAEEEDSEDEIAQLPVSNGRRKTAEEIEAEVVPATSSRPQEAIGQTEMSDLIGEHIIAVANSQPDELALSKSQQRALGDSEAQIAQSQYSTVSAKSRADYLMKTKAALEESSVPPAPMFSSQWVPDAEGTLLPDAEELQQDGIASSPPVTAALPDTVVLNGMQMDGQEVEQLERSAATKITITPVAVANPETLVNVAYTEQTASDKGQPTSLRTTVPDSDVSGDQESQLHNAPAPQLRSTATNAAVPASRSTNNSAPYDTAPTHQSRTPPKKTQSQRTRSGDRTPRSARIRRMTDIAAEPSQELGEGEADIAFNIMNADDKTFDQLVSDSSPIRPSRKRKVYGKSALGDTPKKAPQQQFEQSIPKAQEEEAEDVQQENAEVEHRSAATPSPKLRSTCNARNSGRDRARDIFEAPDATPPSRRRRESRGAAAAVRARKAIPKAPSAAESLPAGKIGKRAGDVLYEDGLVSKRSRSSKIIKTSSSTATRQPKPTVQSAKRQKAVPGPQALVSHAPADLTHVDSTSQGNFVSQLGRPQLSLDLSTVGQADVLFPDRVLAPFKGGSLAQPASYPATCVGLSSGGRLSVRFDDIEGTTDTSLEAYQLRALDLRIGDAVRVNRDGMRKGTYIVTGFRNHIGVPDPDADTGKNVLADIRGFQTVVVAVKQRESLSVVIDGNTFDVAISDIYVTSGMLSRYKDRPYTANAMSRPVQTPSVSVSAPGTPTSRNRRQTNIAHTKSSMFAPANTTPAICKSDGIFAGMVFCISMASNEYETERKATETTLRENGGTVLELGFEGLFKTADSSGSSPSSKRATPKKKQSKATEAPANDSPFELDTAAASAGFAAVIADRHCRTAKYLQALALGLPCLSHYWVTHSLAAGGVLPFSPYLLPAGDSAFLGGATRSRTLPSYDPTTAELRGTISRRNQLLDGKSVLLIMKWDDRRPEKPYVFLAYALGAVRVKQVSTLKEAKGLLDAGEHFDWVYVYGGVDKAEEVLFGNGKGKDKKTGSSSTTAHAAAGKKRRRGEDMASDGPQLEARVGEVNGRLVKVASDEFVKQSLILGALVNE